MTLINTFQGRMIPEPTHMLSCVECLVTEATYYYNICIFISTGDSFRNGEIHTGYVCTHPSGVSKDCTSDVECRSECGKLRMCISWQHMSLMQFSWGSVDDLGWASCLLLPSFSPLNTLIGPFTVSLLWLVSATLHSTGKWSSSYGGKLHSSTLGDLCPSPSCSSPNWLDWA